MDKKGRIYPNWDIIHDFHDPLTEGEKTLAIFFDKNLSEDWKIFVQPYLNGSRPDIVIFNPKKGVIIYEVKDWAIKTYKSGNSKKNTSKHKSQVNHYKKKIIEQLIPDLGEKIDKNSSAYGLVKTVIYLHKIEGQQARELFNCRYPLILGYDDLNESNLGQIIPGIYSSHNGYMTEKWAKDLEFWLNPPLHSVEQTKPIELDKRQKELAKISPGHKRLQGPAGSGKTLIVAYKAAKLASKGYKVLIVTFNITLWHYIRDMIARAPFEFQWSNITFNHFHGFCNDILNELSVSKPHENYLKTIVPTVETTIGGKDIEKFKFDAILIDEGQDYEWEWYNLLSKFLKSRNELFFVCDENQNIYGRNLSWVQDMGRFEGKVQFKGRWAELKEVHRLPKEIGNIANRFSEKFNLKQSVKTSKYTQLTLFERPPLVKWENINLKDWRQNMIDAYETIKNQQITWEEGHASDIAILVPSRDLGKKAVALFKKRNIEVNHVFENENQTKDHHHKKAFWIGDSRLKISTIHSFKGWEAIHVIMLIPPSWRGEEDLDALVYTSMTRTRKNLIVLNCNERYNEFGEKLHEQL
ncbi:AAA domain protein [anaerobic digester metagenome]